MLTIFMAVAVSTVTLGPRSFVNAQTESPTFIEYDETWWPTASSEFLATSEENDTLALNVTDFPTLAPTELTIVFPAPTTPFPSASPTLPGPTTAQPATTPAPSIFPQAAPSTARPQGGGSSGDKKKGSSNDSTVMIIILVVVIIVAIFAAMCCAIVVLRKREKQQSGQRPDRQRYTTPSPSAQPRPLSTGSYCDVDDEGRSVRRTTVTSETADLRDAFYEDEDAISMTSITSDKMEPALRRLIHQEEGMLQDAHEMGMENVLRTS